MTTDQWKSKNKPLKIGTGLSWVFISLWNGKANQSIQHFAETTRMYAIMTDVQLGIFN